jgi:predicted regulator of Ras-like GTPase activity (Roadblock/LC7/MglB family)
MSALSTIVKLPEVKGAVLGDFSGVFLDAVREQDGESIAAVMGFVANSLVQAGEQLGLGTLRRAAVSGELRASLLVVDKRHVLTLKIDPPKALPAVEKQVETSIPGQG